jgi:hypothetical protein
VTGADIGSGACGVSVRVSVPSLLFDEVNEYGIAFPPEVTETVVASTVPVSMLLLNVTRIVELTPMPDALSVGAMPTTAGSSRSA